MLNSTYQDKAASTDLSAYDDLLRDLFRTTPLYIFFTAVKAAVGAQSRH